MHVCRSGRGRLQNSCQLNYATQTEVFSISTQLSWIEEQMRPIYTRRRNFPYIFVPVRHPNPSFAPSHTFCVAFLTNQLAFEILFRRGDTFKPETNCYLQLQSRARHFVCLSGKVSAPRRTGGLLIKGLLFDVPINISSSWRAKFSRHCTQMNNWHRH